MNCKQGDLAYIVSSLCRPDMVGRKIVRVGQFLGHEFGGIWELETPFEDYTMICDSCLRPLRDTDEQDEMLRIAGLPKETV